ncbi:SMI1/KNR4 family protein [Kordia algicida OT-1]|uniref:Knr4/Smi1-like domain-containing protein n=1 Tax=Kordia algicida OT-1 TaxID=391587 RepID=A9DRK5_9FLAO|nr:SMI1/KNR4 family protein [Kordia algicida]EDP96807.1 hypothetical protein KAOT1_16628 [Kordia algicida OT-1]
MKKITLELQEKKVTLNEINSFEKEYGFKLINSYKSFLTENNGGVPIENIFWDGNIASGVSVFFPLKYGKNSLENTISYLHREDALPKTYFPFASTGGASIYAFSMKKENFGEVYIFNFDGSEPFKITNSFEEFIESLEIDE